MVNTNAAQIDYIVPAFVGSIEDCVQVESLASTGCNPQATGHAGCLAPVEHPDNDRVNRIGHVVRHARVRCKAHSLLAIHCSDRLESYRFRVPGGQGDNHPFASGIVRSLKVIA